MLHITKNQFANGAIWKIIEAFSAKGISFIVSVFLARLLLPKDYGIIALTHVFLHFSEILIDGGFSTALIRKKKVDDCDYSCVLTVSFILAIILYMVYFLIAPFVASYYDEPIFITVFRVMGLSLFIQAFTATRTAVVNRNMQFKLLCYCNIFGSLISGIIGVVAAYLGYGVWALVLQRLSQQVLVTASLLIRVKFSMHWQFDYIRLKEIIKFSLGVVCASLLYFISGSMYSVIIGKKYSVTDLGYYSKACQLPEQLSLYSFSAVSSALLPTISYYQDDLLRMKHIIRKVTAFTGYIIFPLMTLLLLTSKEWIVLLFTEKWIMAVPIMTGWCIYYMAMPFSLLHSQVFYALGYSYTKLKVEIIRILMMIAGIIYGIYILKCEINTLSIICGIIMICTAIVTSYLAGKLLSYSVAEIFKDLRTSLVATVVMGTLLWLTNIYLLKFGIKSLFTSLIIKSLIGFFSYVFLSIMFKIESYLEVKSIIFGLIKVRKKSI